MSLRLALTLATLTLATPAFAQQAPVAPPAAPAAPAAPQPQAEPTAEELALTERVETAGEALEGVMEDLGPRAAAVRSDATLSAADKETRIRAMIAEHQPALDEFSSALQALMLVKATSEGASPEQAAQAAAAVSSMVSTQIAQSLITGEDADGE